MNILLCTRHTAYALVFDNQEGVKLSWIFHICSGFQYFQLLVILGDCTCKYTFTVFLFKNTFKMLSSSSSNSALFTACDAATRYCIQQFSHLMRHLLCCSIETKSHLFEQKVKSAEAAWNSRDPDKVSSAYTTDSQWRNRTEFLQGREAIRAFLKKKWEVELDYQ